VVALREPGLRARRATLLPERVSEGAVSVDFPGGARGDVLPITMPEEEEVSDGRKWFKGNLHMHSFWSDGGNFPEMIADHFKSHGYHFVAFTEHDRFQAGERWISDDPAHTPGLALREGSLLDKYLARFGAGWVQTRRANGRTEIRLKPLAEYRGLVEEPERFLIMNGEEVSVHFADGRHWINVINAPEPIGPIETRERSPAAIECVARTAAESARAGGRAVLVSLNHPNYEWNATAEDIAAARGLRFFEVFTALDCTRPRGDEIHASAERIWDIVLSLRLGRPDGEPLYGIATDDCHFYHDDVTFSAHEMRSSHPCRAWVMVRAERLEATAVAAAMAGGDFYATTGVTLKAVEHDADGLRLAVEPLDGASFTTKFIGSRKGVDLSSEPVVDEDGREVRTSRTYSDAVGEVLGESRGLEAAYEFSGDELYVRAVVTSDRPHPNPTVPGDTMKAWTQPVRP